MVLLTTLFVKLAGSQLWPALPLLWALVPFIISSALPRCRWFRQLEEEKLMTVRELVKNKIFYRALLLMLSAGAFELIMSQWSSLFFCRKRARGFEECSATCSAPAYSRCLWNWAHSVWLLGRKIKF